MDDNIGFETEKSLAAVSATGGGTGGAAINRVVDVAPREPGAGPMAGFEKYDETDAGGAGAAAVTAEGAAATGDSDCLRRPWAARAPAVAAPAATFEVLARSGFEKKNPFSCDAAPCVATGDATPPGKDGSLGSALRAL